LGLLLTSLIDNIGTITLFNDKKRNCLSTQLLNELIDALNYFRAEKARVIIIRALKGSKIWSSGFDINELPEPGRAPLHYFDPLEQALREVQNHPAPVIAMIEGGVWGGACDLAFVCDIIIATHSATFAITPSKIGVPYNTSGILHFINIVGYHVAKEMFFTAQPMSAERALNHGIINHLLPENEIESYTYNMAKSIKQNSPLSITAIKEQIKILFNSQSVSPETFELIEGLRRRVYDSEDYIEGKKAFLEKRIPVFQGT
jgi:methylmalonyl-CoA decarboxylase